MPDQNSEEFPSNSKSKKIEKVTRGKIIQRKEPLLDRIFGGPAASELGSYIFWDVLIPAAKSTIMDIINNSTEMIFYGGERKTGRSRRTYRDRGRTYVSYNSIYDNRSVEPERRSRNKSRHRFDDIILTTRADAEEVLSVLLELLDLYDLATVADFYTAVGLDTDYTDNKYGWDNLSNSQIRPVRGGYILELPKPFPIG